MATALEDYLLSLINLNNRYKELEKELESLEKDRVDLYHIMECVSLDAYRFNKISYRLRDTLRKRREVKEEMYRLQPIVESHRTDKVYNSINKSKIRVDRIKKESLESFKRFDDIITFDNE